MSQNSYDVQIDVRKRVVEFTVQEGLSLPVKVKIPVAVIKAAAGQVNVLESQLEQAGQLHVGAVLLGGANENGGPQG
jgi:hypothetical protein